MLPQFLSLFHRLSYSNSQWWCNVALADFWQLKDNQILGGRNILNVYHLKRILSGATATQVAQSFLDSILTGGFRGLQDNNLTRTTVEVENLGDPLDFAALDSSGKTGTDTGDHPAIFNAATIQFNRTRTDMKNGQKRFLFGNDVDAVDGVWVAAFLTGLDAVALSIITPWEEIAAPGVDVCEFVILKRFCVVDGQKPCLKYRLPDDNDEIDDNHYVPISTVSRDRIRSQVSRKRLI